MDEFVGGSGIRPFAASTILLFSGAADAGPAAQPPGVNLTYGDVTHGRRVQSASGNPAAAAADLARLGRDARSGVVVSASTGLEYGNIQDWFDTNIDDRPNQLVVGGQVRLLIDAVRAVQFILQNDSSIATKSSQLYSRRGGYSRAAYSNESGTLYLGGKAHLHFMQLSRLSVRFGDITDSEELFDEIRDADFEDDARVGLDIGALWVGENYQLGAQLTSINEPDFRFPDVDLTPCWRWATTPIAAGCRASVSGSGRTWRGRK